MKKYSSILPVLVLCLLSQISVAQKLFDFEDGKLPSEFVFSRGSHWRITPHGLHGAYSLCDSVVPQNTAVSESFSFTSPHSKLAVADTFRAVVKFVYGTGATAVTSTNRFVLFLGANVGASDSLSLTNEKLKSLALTFNGTSGDDTLRLFYVQNKKLTTLISTKVRCNNNKLAVQLVRSVQGIFTLSVSTDGTFGNMQSYVANELPHSFEGVNVGAHLATSTANYRKWLQLDNIYTHFAFRPLQITNLQRKGLRSLHVTLNKGLKMESATDKSHYKLLRTESGENLPIDSVKYISDKEVQLFINQDFTSNSYTLEINSARDADDSEDSVTHNFSLEVLRYGDLVFSELMVHPNSESELPEEYIEIFNRTHHDIDLSGFTIASPTRVGRITQGVIGARSYAVLGNIPRVQNPVSVTSRPTLTDAGLNLTLRDGYDVPLATLTYSDSWYADEMKKLGGWSLEKIDLDNLEESAQNWHATTDERGGTPFGTNAIAKSNQDVTPPYCTSFKVVHGSIKLEFNEALRAVNSHFTLTDCEEFIPTLFTMISPTCVMLYPTCSLEKDKVYTLRAEDAVCDFAGNCIRDFNLQLGWGGKPAVGDVVINEVLFNPYAGGVDFVELYNRSSKIVELQGARIANRKLATGAIEKSYTLPTYTLLPNNYVVITTKPEIVKAHYNCQNPNAFIVLSTLPSYSNDAGCVTLLNSDSTLLEDFYYTEKMHSGALVNKKGVSLERINPDRVASEGANWLSAAQTVGFATPTYKNSQYSAHSFNGDNAFSIYPETFSPDGDGVDDQLFISYKMPAEGYVANITVFTSAGKIAKTLCRNATLAAEGQLSWDGMCDNGKVADVGIYIIYAEVFSLSGEVNRYKKTCVVGARF